MFVWILMLVATVTATGDTQVDPVKDFLPLYKSKQKATPQAVTTTNGAIVSYNDANNMLNSIILNNQHFVDMITGMNREKIPERINHAKGAGAFGYFKVTANISHICKADFLSEVGKETPIAVRFSSSTGEKGSSDLVREFRGFSVKFYTKEGNFDIPGFNTPVFFSKDPSRFVTLSHAAKRNPATNVRDSNALWDAITLMPESMHMFLYVYGDRGIPRRFTNMPGHGIHTYQLVNKYGEIHLVKFHFIPTDGIKHLGSEEAKNISASDLDYFTRELYESIAKGHIPSWTCSLQILTLDDLERLGSDAIDITKVLPTSEFPLHEVGKLYLNRNPKNFHADIEQLAFCPANLVPGILGGSDLLYQSRRLAYRDAQHYRLGINFNKIPVNCPFQVTETLTYNRDGRPPVLTNEGGRPNYYPNSFQNVYLSNETSQLITVYEEKADNLDQCTELYANEYSTEEQDRLIENLVAALQDVTREVQDRAVNLLTAIHTDLGSRVAKGLNNTSNSIN